VPRGFKTPELPVNCQSILKRGSWSWGSRVSSSLLKVIPKFLKKALKWQMKSGMLRVNKEEVKMLNPPYQS
jgi:hypothetical protein